jgi:homocysteine S-methyltransferase
MIDSVRLAQEARERYCQEIRSGPRPLVAASIGCYGATLHDGSEYRGAYGLSAQQLGDWHRPRFELLAHSGADLLACETIPCLAEAEALVRLAAEHPQTPLWLSFSCRDESRVCHGETLAECVALAQGLANVVAVGINCTPPGLIEPLLRSLAATSACPLLVYPNSGETWDAHQRCWRCADADAQDWGQLARTWYQAGARLIGGCCRTTPETIRKIASESSRGVL